MRTGKPIIKYFLFAGIVLFSGSFFIVFQTDILREKDLLRNPPAKRCADCHKRIYDQWQKSRHAKAWISEGYKKETENHRKTKCFGCHIPREISFDNKPEFRDNHLEDAISCLACHFREKTMRGPHKVFSPPHPSQKDSTYTQSKICKGCHVKSYKQWEKTRSAKPCQECHMPGKTEKMVDTSPLASLPFHKRVTVGDHSTPVIPATEKDLLFHMESDQGTLKITLENTGIPHSLPTAENGDPRIYMEVDFLAGNDVISQEKKIFSPQLETALQFREKRKAVFRIPENCERIEVRLLLRRAWKKEKELLLERNLNF